MNHKDLPRDSEGSIDIDRVEWPVTIDLRRPVEIDGELLERLELREPSAMDIELAWNRGAGEMTRMVHLVALLAGLKPDSVRRLKGADFLRTARVLNSFLT